MRRTIWVLENIKKDFNFYQRFNILNLLSSVSLWRKYHPEDCLELYCDYMTYYLLQYLDVLELWDQVHPQEFIDPKIDKSIFWAASKLEILSQIEEPVTVVDNDWLAFKNFDEIRSSADVVYSHNENGIDYYLNDTNPLITSLKKTELSGMFPMTQEAANVSFLSFNNLDLMKKYSALAMQLMEEWTEMGIKDNRLIIYAEQKLLKQLIRTENASSKALVKNIWLCRAYNWSNSMSENGEWMNTEIWDKFKHYGPTKRYFKDEKEGYDYDKEIDFMFNCVRSLKESAINISLLKERLKIIDRK